MRFVVHGAGGLDEFRFRKHRARGQRGAVRRFHRSPEEFGVSRAPTRSARGGTAAENAAIIHRVLLARLAHFRDIV